MGRAGILVWPTVVIVLGIIIYLIVRLIQRSSSSTSVRKNAELTDEAMIIFKSLMIVDSLDGDIDYLTERSKGKIKSWVERYRKVNS